MSRPSIVDTLKYFSVVPPRFIVDVTILDETWEWACEIGADLPEPAFSADETPVLCWHAVLDPGDQDSAPVYQTPSGIVLQ